MGKEISTPSLSDVYTGQRRRRRRIILGLMLLAFYAVFWGGIWLAVRSPLFRIQKIEISGNHRVSESDIMTFFQSEVFENSFWKRALGFRNSIIWPAHFSLADPKLFPQLKSVSIEKSYLRRTVEVIVEERQPFGIWCFHQAQTEADQTETNGETPSSSSVTVGDSPSGLSNSVLRQHTSVPVCFWFDKEGFLFKRSIGVQGSLIIVVNDYSQKNLGLNSRIVPPEFIPNLFSLFRVLSESGLGIREIRLNDLGLQEIEVDTYPSTALGAGDGPKLYFGLRFRPDNSLAVIRSLKNQSNFNALEYIDFRVENRAYYK